MTRREQLEAIRKRPGLKSQRHLGHPLPSPSLICTSQDPPHSKAHRSSATHGRADACDRRTGCSLSSPAGFSAPKAANGQKKKKAGLFSLYLSDGTHSFGAAFTEDQPLVYMQVLRGFDEAKVHCGFVPCPQAVLVHAENRGRLTDAATMHCECNAQRLSTAGAASGIGFRQTSKVALVTLQLTVLSLKRKNLLRTTDYMGQAPAFVQYSKRKHA